jgi:hypothetical protein
MPNEDQVASFDHLEPVIQTYPTIQIEGRQIEVRFKLGDVLRLQKEHGIDILAPDFGVERTLTILAMGISHEIHKTPQELGDLFDFGDISYVGEIVSQALKKVSTEAAIPAQQRAQQQRRLQLLKPAGSA